MVVSHHVSAGNEPGSLANTGALTNESFFQPYLQPLYNSSTSSVVTKFTYTFQLPKECFLKKKSECLGHTQDQQKQTLRKEQSWNFILLESISCDSQMQPMGWDPSISKIKAESGIRSTQLLRGCCMLQILHPWIKEHGKQKQITVEIQVVLKCYPASCHCRTVNSKSYGVLRSELGLKILYFQYVPRWC